ncbi:prepilin-type N-terminal cleavage/methylation domain-containing protein [Janthinobacterium sp. FW305-129]|uniref:PulJ/GspJ family protein n=1 Tax=Janthinobacterium sp. FW305-129 TaxID=2775054 RepID=UPI001E638F8A|nr:prepilin-type N-terminal cleavage/methylation domain-containing protein [Janthinobacterium sp. FW305-129]MCC7598768.1 prepilin-type N-terminal cleavage/methylation domain-containing protein [Janthinobacterium sp. FW305-129]
MARRKLSTAGFTLIELLVAIGILAMVAVLGWRGLDSIVRSREVLTSQLNQARGMQLAFAQMQSDCDHLAGAGQNNNLLNGRINLSAENDRLTLVRLAASEQEPQQLQVVTYRLRGGVLTRRESNGTRDLAVLDTLWQAARDDTDTSSADVALMRGVDSMVMRGQKRQNSPNPEWITMLAGTKTDDFVGLEVTLQMPGQDAGLSKVFLLGPG